MNILVIRLKSIGDVVLTLSALNTLRDNFPSANISFLVSHENTPLLTGFREVNEVIALDRAAFRSGNPVKIIGEFFRLARRLRAGKFDLVVDFQGYGETAWLTRLTGAPKRWGSVYGKGRKWAYTLGVPRDNGMQHAERFLAILKNGGLTMTQPRNTFALPPSVSIAVSEFFQSHQLDPARPVLFIQPFTSTPGRDWPLENFLTLAEHWQSRGWQVLFGGGPGDRARLEAALAGRHVTSAGVSLLVTAGLMQASQLVIGGDTGALHLAVALQRRVLMIMSSGAVKSAHPFQHRDWVVTPRAGENVQSLSVAEVLSACDRVLHKSIEAT